MKDNVIRMAVCPLCGKTYAEPPALSREDNETLICPDCGTRQALDSIGIGKELVQYLLDAVNNIFKIVSLSGIQILIFLAALQQNGEQNN